MFSKWLVCDLNPIFVALLIFWPLGSSSFAVEVTGSHGRAACALNEHTGAYRVELRDWKWDFSGKLPSACHQVAKDSGSDSLGRYQEIRFQWKVGELPMSGSIRIYQARALILFCDTCDASSETPPPPFPDFTNLPAGLHVFSYGKENFSPGSFRANDACTPWLLFDAQDHAMVISPASHFMVASMFGNGHDRIASGYNRSLRNLPRGCSQRTMLVFGKGINTDWDLWGRSLNELRGAERPGNEADTVLKYLGYWTDNGATYYYNYDVHRGYAGTLRALVKRYRREHIPIRYLQLDSWWYPKTFRSAGGRMGGTKNPRLPAGKWNRYGGMLEYRADSALFPNGLAAFQKSIGLPLVTHNRWIDPESPYHEKYRISGVAAVDPRWWNMIAKYLHRNGVVTYEQDWLDQIYDYSPAFSSNLTTGASFVRDMARACRRHDLTMQYCMPYPCYFLEGSRYEDLTTIRVSDDRFGPSRWNHFLYTSRLARSLGIWPWSDVFMSRETNNLLLATLSAGPVGIGDRMGQEDAGNIFKAVRKDGVIVKPDVPCVPLDQCYLSDATHQHTPLIACTYTDHRGLRTSYVFIYNRNSHASETATFEPAELGDDGSVCVYETAAAKVHWMKSDQRFSARLPAKGAGFYEVAPVGPSGIAFFGDRGKFVSTGKQRISRIAEAPGKLTVTVLFCAGEKSVVLHGCSATPPTISVRGGTADPLRYHPKERYFDVTVHPHPSATSARTKDTIKQVIVTFQMKGASSGQ